ncbi:MAG: glycosyltransferase family 4 protein [Phycisphaerales bacterium]|nr:glycosyltransferase family 4 protein [Phycisphaerales bacterium]
MRVLMINQVFYPDVAATAQHAHDLAKHLVGHGHQVDVIASRSIYGHSGAALPKREVVDGIDVHRVGRSYFGKSSTLARLIDFGLFFVRATMKALFIRKPDVVICFTTPPLIALVGVLLKTLSGRAFVYWVMDLYPDLPVACGVMKKDGWAARVCESLHRMCLRRADRCVVLGRCMKRRVLEKGIKPDQVEVIHVWSDDQEVRPVAREANAYRKEWGLDDAFVVMYSGNYGVGHDVETMLEAASLLKGRSDIRFAFVGGGVRKKEVEQYIREHQLTNAQSQPYQPRERLGELLSAADLHLGSQSDGMVGLFVPSKLFGVMAAARPMVFIGSGQAENGLVITENKCGAVVECGNGKGLAELIEHLADHRDEAAEMGERGRWALIDYYSRQNGCQAWEDLLRECVEGGKADAKARDAESESVAAVGYTRSASGTIRTADPAESEI